MNKLEIASEAGRNYQQHMDKLYHLIIAVRELPVVSELNESYVAHQFESFVRTATESLVYCIDFQRRHYEGSRFKLERRALGVKAYDFNRACLAKIKCKNIEGIAI